MPIPKSPLATMADLTIDQTFFRKLYDEVGEDEVLFLAGELPNGGRVLTLDNSTDLGKALICASVYVDSFDAMVEEPYSPDFKSNIEFLRKRAAQCILDAGDEYSDLALGGMVQAENHDHAPRGMPLAAHDRWLNFFRTGCDEGDFSSGSDGKTSSQNEGGAARDTNSAEDADDAVVPDSTAKLSVIDEQGECSSRVGVTLDQIELVDSVGGVTGCSRSEMVDHARGTAVVSEPYVMLSVVPYIGSSQQEDSIFIAHNLCDSAVSRIRVPEYTSAHSSSGSCYLCMSIFAALRRRTDYSGSEAPAIRILAHLGYMLGSRLSSEALGSINWTVPLPGTVSVAEWAELHPSVFADEE